MHDLSKSGTSLTLLGRVQAASDDHDAWKLFVDRYGPKIHTWCRGWNLQLADAEDVTQLVLAKMAQNLRHFRYDPSKSFRAWLKTVTHHAWRDFMDGQKPGQRGSGDPDLQRLLDNVEAPRLLEQHLQQEFHRDLLEEAMSQVRARVEPKTWEAFRLRSYDGKSGQDVADQLGLSLPAVFMAKNRVLKMLREEMRRLDP